MEAYIFTDSNIDLLKLNELNSMNFLNLILEKSFLPTIAKATRFQNLSKSLIDQILINKNCELIYSGTIISDLSDHFFTFIAPPGQRKNSHQNHRSVVARDYSLHNLNNFKQDLAVTDWGGVLSSNDVDESYAEFWNCYKTCHDANFPLKRKRFNKNIHKKNEFMTQGLLISRNTKNKLHKKQQQNLLWGIFKGTKLLKHFIFGFSGAPKKCTLQIN
jgi:hypothetical protein